MLIEEESKQSTKSHPLEESFAIQLRLEQIRRESDMLKKDLDSLLAGCLSRGETENERYQLIEIETVKRPINRDKFLKLFPKEFRKIATVTLKDAKKMLGDEMIEPTREDVITIHRKVIMKDIKESTTR